MILDTGFYEKHSPKCIEIGCHCRLIFRGVRAVEDCCGSCNSRMECLMVSTPILQAVAMVEVTSELRKMHDMWDEGDEFRIFYGNLVANTKEDIVETYNRLDS
jgi:hypothetical protein